MREGAPGNGARTRAGCAREHQPHTLHGRSARRARNRAKPRDAAIGFSITTVAVMERTNASTHASTSSRALVQLVGHLRDHAREAALVSFDEMLRTNDNQALPISFALIMLPQGFVIRRVPAWEGADARTPSACGVAAEALKTVTHAYDARWRELLGEISQGLLPFEVLTRVPLTYVNGCALAEVWDYRRCAPRGLPDINVAVLKPTSATISRDAEIEAKELDQSSPLGDVDAERARRFALEGALLAITAKPLRLDICAPDPP